MDTKKAEGGQVEPAVSANSKPVKRRLDEFVNDEESDNDRDVVLMKSKAATLISTKRADRKMKEKVKPRLSSGNKERNKEKTGRRKMIIASDDEEEAWDEDAEAEEEESSSGKDMVMRTLRNRILRIATRKRVW